MSKTSPRRVSDRQRRTRAVELRVQGLTYQEIADRLDYNDRSAARHAVVSVLDQHEAEGVDELRAIHWMRQETIVRTLLPLAQGKDADGQPVGADIQTKAVNALNRTLDSQARLMGMNREPAHPEHQIQTLVVNASMLPRASLDAIGMADEDGVIDVSVDPD